MPRPRPHPRHATVQPFAIAVTGHQNLGSQVTSRFVSNAFALLLQRLQQEHPEGLVALSGLAAGADTLFAEAALKLHIPLEGIIAHAQLLDDFAPGPDQERYLRLRDRSRMLHQLPFAERSVAAYIALGHRLIDSCDLLLAAWNGLPPADEGGTGGVVAYALSCGKPVIRIDTARHTVADLPAV
jgi:hypothetical protein